MKHFVKKSAVLLMAIAMVFATLGFTACSKEASKTYTVKVVDPDGNPYAGVEVQVCKANDANGFCISAPTNEQGVATFEVGKEITDTSVDLMDVHLLGLRNEAGKLMNLPPYLSYAEPITMRRGQTITVQVSYRTPKSGTGKGGYTTRKVGDEYIEEFDMSIFDPYVVEEAAYRVKFSDAEQKIYFAFKPIEAAIYKVYSVGEVDASITELFGSLDNAVRNPHDPDYQNDNISDTDTNFSYEFEVGESVLLQGDKRIYFEMALEKAAHVNTDFFVYFEYVGELDVPSLTTVDVTPQKALTDYADQSGAFVDADLSGDYVLNTTDGYYYVGDLSGPTLIATLGTYEALNPRHEGKVVIPRGMDAGFMTVSENQSILVIKEGIYYNYLPLVTEYVKKSNSDGRYPVTAELKQFLEDYILLIGGAKEHAQSELGFLPAGKEWLFACGYYA